MGLTASGVWHRTISRFGQCAAVVISGVGAFGYTWGMLRLIDCFTPVTVGAEADERMNEVLHGAKAYLTP